MNVAEAEQLDFEKVIKETDKAYQVRFDARNIVWVPKSQTRIMDNILYAPKWLVEDKALTDFLIK
jgi:hypothetical protein